jgi:hypothetical protein
MDSFLKKNNDDVKAAPAEEKKIEFKCIKEKKCMRTYMFNLEHFISDAKQLDIATTGIQKAIGTGCTKKETDFGIGYGFNGDLAKRIKKYLLDKKLVVENNFA